ncbi:MAG: hypothetical protein IKE27_10560 [Oscillospiraceae bacterium]|nr:hypothetical protein [Oscillospiraceae bacterium]
MKYALPVILIIALILTACAPAGNGQTNSAGNTYKQIDQETAKEMMAKDDGHVIVDVRRPDEYAEGHIPDAINIPNEQIGSEPPEELPDYDQVILVYCRTGNRSKQASEKLASMGYSNVYEFGGITDWKGDIVVEEDTSYGDSLVFRFDSFGGGGRGYVANVDDPDIVSVRRSTTGGNEDPDEVIDGGTYQVLFAFEGLKPGETTVTIYGISPMSDSYNTKNVYKVSVRDDLKIKAELTEEVDYFELPEEEAIHPEGKLCVSIGDRVFYPVLEDNSSAEYFRAMLNDGLITVDMSDYGGFEKVGSLSWEVPTNDEQINTVPGDIILYQGNKITIYYGENSWSLTKLGHIDGVTGEELLEAMGQGNVTVRFWIEWSE